MNKILLLLILSLTAFSAFAGNAVLLTSIHLKKMNYRYLEKKFRENYKSSGLNIVIHHETTPSILHKIMHDEETEVVIWVSHAGGEHPSENGMAAKGVILDFYGNNVKNFFTHIPPKLKFLGIVGCSAESIFKGFSERGNFDAFPNLEIKSFNKPVKLYSGLKETLKASAGHLQKEMKAVPQTEDEKVEIEIIRHGNTTRSWLELGDKVIAMMDDLKTEYQATIPTTAWMKTKNKNIKLVRDRSQSENLLLEHLEIKSNEKFEWKLFSLPGGTALGSKDQHLYVQFGN